MNKNKLIMNKKIWFIGLVMLVTLLAIISFSQKASANPSYFAPIAVSATATSSPQFLVVGGSSTSTPLIYDSYGIDGTNQNAGQTSDATDSVSLLMYVQASSTSSVFKTFVQYSDGVIGVSCKTTPDACDWYENNSETYAAGNIAIATPNTYSYTYASTSQDSLITFRAAENRGTKLITLKVPTRYIRVITTVTGTNGSVYMKFVPKKQRVQ